MEQNINLGIHSRNKIEDIVSGDPNEKNSWFWLID